MAELTQSREEMEEGMFDALTELKELLRPEIEIGMVEKMVHTPGAQFPIEFQRAQFPFDLEQPDKASLIFRGVGELIMKGREPLSDTDKNVTIPRVQELITQMTACCFEYTRNKDAEGRSIKLIWHTQKDLLVVSYEGGAAVKIDFSYDDDEELESDSAGAQSPGEENTGTPPSES